jgi:methyl-accepting chemotaxis protein
VSNLSANNAGNSAAARDLADQAYEASDRSVMVVETLALTMESISGKGEEMGKFVKTVNEIAFQTNLLALNAAVEAARAGTAGAGFAVVADEVRNLSRRAEEAANRVGELIGETRGDIAVAEDLLHTTRAEFDVAIQAVGKVKALTVEITAASEEQTREIAAVGSTVSNVRDFVRATADEAERLVPEDRRAAPAVARPAPSLRRIARASARG